MKNSPFLSVQFYELWPKRYSRETTTTFKRETISITPNVPFYPHAVDHSQHAQLLARTNLIPIV